MAPRGQKPMRSGGAIAVPVTGLSRVLRGRHLQSIYCGRGYLNRLSKNSCARHLAVPWCSKSSRISDYAAVPARWRYATCRRSLRFSPTCCRGGDEIGPRAQARVTSAKFATPDSQRTGQTTGIHMTGQACAGAIPRRSSVAQTARSPENAFARGLAGRARDGPRASTFAGVWLPPREPSRIQHPARRSPNV